MPTLADVAERSGVSKSTASRVLNGLAQQFRISKPTVSLVEAAARELGYRPNYAAQALTSGRTKTIGLIGPIPDDDPWGRDFFAPIMAGISEQTRLSGFSLMLTPHNRDNMGLDPATTRQVEALVAPGFVMSPSFSGLDLEALAIPMALVTDPPVPSRHPIVTFDATPGVEAACHHLLELGHRRIAWIGLRYSRNIGDQKHVRKDDDQDGRRATLSRCLKSAGLELVDDITIQLPEQLDRDRARQLDRLAKDLLWERKRLGAATAFVCFNDIMACAAIRALGAMGLSTPGDTSVVGVDNLWGDLLDPALTTIDMHLSAIGRRAAEIAIHMADHPRKRDRWTHQREIIPSTLVTRNSTGPAPHKES